MPRDCLECGLCESCIDRSIAAAEPPPSPEITERFLLSLGYSITSKCGHLIVYQRLYEIGGKWAHSIVDYSCWKGVWRWKVDIFGESGSMPGEVREVRLYNPTEAEFFAGCELMRVPMSRWIVDKRGGRVLAPNQ
jgi:hypothetical protein